MDGIDQQILEKHEKLLEVYNKQINIIDKIIKELNNQSPILNSILSDKEKNLDIQDLSS